ncbi:MAG: DUF2837 family protein [Candidatus Eremiobacterota bacterium]
MDIQLLSDPRLVFVMVLSGVVSMLTTLNVAARPAAVSSRQVATAFTISQLFFMITRFANLFYLPLMAHFVDNAVRTGNTADLYGQVQWVIAGAGVGALFSWILLPTFVELYRRGIRSLRYRQSMLSVLLRLATLTGWRAALGALRPAGNLGTRLLRLEGVPAGFLWINVLATAIWTVGALCAVYVSGLSPRYEATALLLSGLVNSVAAIAFSLFVDPQAALITDRAVAVLKDLERRLPALCLGAPGAGPSLLPFGLAYRVGPGGLRVLQPGCALQTDLLAAGLVEDPRERRVRIVAVHLSAGNFLGAMLGLLVYPSGVKAIQHATLALGQMGESLVHALWLVVLLNVGVTLLASTTVSSRVSAVLTRRVATALTIYNFFFLVTRLTQQVYAPVLGSIRDNVLAGQAADPQALEVMFRWILLGAAGGSLLGWLLMPTFIEIYCKAIHALERCGSIALLLLRCLDPRKWGTMLGCLRPPSLLGLNRRAIRGLPKAFLYGNVLVISIHTVALLASIHAGAVGKEVSRTATLLSSVVNGVATITLSVLVDPRVALITDQTIDGRRPMEQLNAMAVLLMAGMFVGTLLSQALFEPASWAILKAARLVEWIL